MDIITHRPNLWRAGILFAISTMPYGGDTAAETVPTQTASSSAPQAIAATAVRPYPQAFSVVLEDVSKVATTLGIVAAGVWAYFHYFRGRTYRPRLEPHVSANIMVANGKACVSVTYGVRNVGLSKVDVRQAGSALTLETPGVNRADTGFQEIKWVNVATLDIFTNHGWIEPGELVEEQRLIALPHNDYFAFRLELRLVSQADTEWTAMAVAHSNPLSNPSTKDRDG